MITLLKNVMGFVLIIFVYLLDLVFDILADNPIQKQLNEYYEAVERNGGQN